MLREMGLVLLLGSIGLSSGSVFVQSIADGGYMWFVYALILALVPALITGLVAYFLLQIDLGRIVGLIAGTMTNPYALSYMQDRLGRRDLAETYTCVYPLAMFLWVMAAQIMVLF